MEAFVASSPSALFLLLCGTAWAQPPASAPNAPTPKPGVDLEVIRSRGTLRCGVQGPSNPGFGALYSQGVWNGFNIDLCRGIATLVLGDPDKITIVALTTQTRFPALQSGEIGVMTNNTTWTMLRDTQVGFAFPAMTFFDGQGIMVKKAAGIDSATKLDGATVCVPPGTTTEVQLNDWLRAREMKFTPVVI